ncbi:hypothetical protein GQ55_1G138800 [Panicum hallii var. hallii]|uniref:Uncharacterized protein n=1 Tax=Panicum hallii var. hallii TaxID=1504633 RepID=A0A2T7F580_9POAL|nr:hypothetical protein GQ55_1G138800 [Panicum hallii var. hallii]
MTQTIHPSPTSSITRSPPPPPRPPSPGDAFPPGLLSLHDSTPSLTWQLALPSVLASRLSLGDRGRPSLRLRGHGRCVLLRCPRVVAAAWGLQCCKLWPRLRALTAAPAGPAACGWLPAGRTSSQPPRVSVIARSRSCRLRTTIA